MQQRTTVSWFKKIRNTEDNLQRMRETLNKKKTLQATEKDLEDRKKHQNEAKINLVKEP